MHLTMHDTSHGTSHATQQAEGVMFLICRSVRSVLGFLTCRSVSQSWVFLPVHVSVSPGVVFPAQLLFKRQTTAQNFVKLCRYLGPNVLIKCILPGISFEFRILAIY